MKKLILLLFFIFPVFLFSQATPIQLFKQFNGRYDFTALGNTLNAAENNGGYCDMLTQSSATLNLEPGQTMLSAHLYWASIGTGDFDINLNGNPISADRTFAYSNAGKPYFSGYADVTDLVAANGNGTYTFSGLEVGNILQEYCLGTGGAGTNFGGWAIYVIYEEPGLLLNQISLFDGLQGTASISFPINLNLTNLNVTSDQASKIGFLAWEGDRGISVQESLFINGQLISDPPLNPANNAFNGTNSYIGPPENAENYNMDLDYYSLVGIVQPGDISMQIKLTSNQDWIMMNNLIVKVNSELPDATIVIDDFSELCGDQFLEVNYTVRNYNSTAPLPAQVPIAFYANDVLIGQARTTNVIPRESSESGSIILPIPEGTPPIFTLKTVVDDDGTGNGEFREINENNNEFEVEAELGSPLESLSIFGNNEMCDGGTETLTALPDNLDTYNWFRNGVPFGGNTSSIEITESGSYTVNGYLDPCFYPDSPEFNVTFYTLPEVNNSPEPLVSCDNNGFAFFNLNDADLDITIGNTNLIVTYYETLENATTRINPLDSPYENIVPFYQIVFARVESPAPPIGTGCFTIVELELVVNQLPDDSAEVSDYILCAVDNNEIGTFNLDTKTSEILGQQTDPPYSVSFYLSQADAENQINAIVNTTGHQNKDASNNPINPQTIYVGIEETEFGCYVGGNQSFNLIVKEGAIAVAPAEPFLICDNLQPLDDFAEFNLDNISDSQVADLHTEILGGQDPAIYGITFHETIEQAENGTDAISFPYINNANPQIIYVRVTNMVDPDEPRCYAVVDMTIEVEELMEVILDDQYRLCVDENGNPIAEEEGGMSPPIIDTRLDPALFTFIWELNGVIIPETSPSIIALEGGEYTVTYTELSTTCQNTVSATVIVSSAPFTYEAEVITGAFASNSIIEATASGEGTYHFQLDDGPFQESGIFENVGPGEHIVTIKDIYGCGSVKIELRVINFPPFLTPNDDGYHDTWNIIGIAEFDPTANIYIFDRFGKLLKQLSPLGPGWDGTYIGNPMPSSDYWFRVEYTEDEQTKEFKGHFTLKR